MDCSGVTIPVLKQYRCEVPGALLAWNMFFDLHNQCNYKSGLFHHNEKPVTCQEEKKIKFCAHLRGTCQERWINGSACVPSSGVQRVHLPRGEALLRHLAQARALRLPDRQNDSFHLGTPWWKCIYSCSCIPRFALGGLSADSRGPRA